MVTKFDSDGQLDLLVVNSPVSGISACNFLANSIQMDNFVPKTDTQTHRQTDTLLIFVL